MRHTVCVANSEKPEVEVDERHLFQELGRAIQRARKRTGMTQEGLASAIGVSRTTVVNLEAGRQHPPLITLYKVAAKLTAELGDLLPAVPEVTELQEVQTEHGPLPPKVAAVLQEFEEAGDGHRDGPRGSKGV